MSDVYQDIHEDVRRRVARAKVSDPDKVADLVTDALQAHCGGQRIFFPKQSRAQKEKRNEAIRREFTGTAESMKKVCNDYGVKPDTVYRAVSKRPARKRGRRG